VSAAAALAWSNVHPQSYEGTFQYPLAVGGGGTNIGFTPRMLINDGLMAIFFFVVGMEIKRELVVGELNTIAKASLPAIAALGGMVVPAGIFLAFNWGGAGQHGWGIPMATDIAFCVGILTVLGRRVSRALVVFVTALAIFDDIGGILVIALFYGHGLSAAWLVGAAGACILLLVMNRAHVTSGLAYGLAGVVLWYALHNGGVHATISGVLVGLAIPVRPRGAPREVLRELSDHVSRIASKPDDEDLDAAEILMIEEKLEDLGSPVQRFTHALHPLVAFFVMPVFALANSGVSISDVGLSSLAAPVALGTAAGLLLGKPLGIFGLTVLAVRLGVAPMPGQSSLANLFGTAVIAGIGFTVALFIAALAFHDAASLLNQAKLGILLGSFLAGLLGFLILRFASHPAETT
jgi:NhaA family Na+:H+ antiporter